MAHEYIPDDLITAIKLIKNFKDSKNHCIPHQTSFISVNEYFVISFGTYIQTLDVIMQDRNLLKEHA